MSNRASQKRPGKLQASLRLVLIPLFFGLTFYAAWRGRGWGVVALLLVVLFLIDNSVNVLFGMLDEKVNRRAGLRFWISNVFWGTRGIQLIRSDGTIRPVRPVGPLAEIFARLGAPGMVIIENGVAVVFERSGKFTRVEKPGVAFTTRFEFPAHIIDLRPQVRSRSVKKVLTRDGLSFDIDPLDVLFEVGTDFDSKKGEYSFSEEAVLDLVYRGGKIHQNGEAIEWGARVASLVESVIRQTAATRPFLQIVRSTRKGSARQQFIDEVVEQARPALRQIGVHLIGIDIGRISVPKEAEEYLALDLKRRVDVGMAEAQQQAITKIAKGLEEALSTISGVQPQGDASRLLIHLSQVLERTSRDFYQLVSPYRDIRIGRPFLLQEGKEGKEEEPPPSGEKPVGPTPRQ